MQHDRYGYPVNTESRDAADAYREGLDLFLAAQDGAEDAFSRAIELDLEFSLARVGLARVLQTAARTGEAVEVIRQADSPFTQSVRSFNRKTPRCTESPGYTDMRGLDYGNIRRLPCLVVLGCTAVVRLSVC